MMLGHVESSSQISYTQKTVKMPKEAIYFCCLNCYIEIVGVAHRMHVNFKSRSCIAVADNENKKVLF
jgi:hypothetical protein